MAFVQIPLSNTLRMVRTDDQSSNLQNFSNRLLQQENYVDYNERPYAQKISSEDYILQQFATDVLLANITAKLYDMNDIEVGDVTSSITLQRVSTSWSIYDLKFKVASQGHYYLKIDFNSEEIHESEIFVIDDFVAENMLKIEYNTSENDGILYNDDQTFIIRVEGRLVEFRPGQNKETYTNFNESLTNLKAYPIREFDFEYGPIPRYMVEKLNLALSHEVFKVNDVKYQTTDGPDTDLLKDGIRVTNLYHGDFRIQEQDYENYIEISDDVEPETNHILIDESAGKLIIKDQGTEYFTRYKDS